MHLSDTFAYKRSCDVDYECNMAKFRIDCISCCSDCICTFDEKLYVSVSLNRFEESTFAGGYLMKLVHILRNIYLLGKSGRSTLDTLLTTSECVHLKLFYQNLVLTTANMDPGNVLGAKTILAIAVNWLAMRHAVLYSSLVETLAM